MKRIKNFLFFLIILFGIDALAQDAAPETVIINNDTIIVQAFPLADISQKIADTYNQLKEIQKFINSYHDQKSIDSLTIAGKKYMTTEIKRIEKVKNTMSGRELQDEKKKWKKIKHSLENWRIKFKDRTVKLNDLSKKLNLLLKRWSLTFDEAKKQNVPVKLRKDIQSTIQDIKVLDNELVKKQNELYLNQNNVTEFILTVDDIIAELEKVRMSYLNMDSTPIWKSYDSVGFKTLIKIQIPKYLHESSKNLKSFFEDSLNNVALNIIVFILILIILYSLKKIIEKRETEKIFEQEGVRFFISNYLLTALILALFSSGWIFPIRTSIVNDILRISIFGVGLILLYRLYGKKFFQFMLLLIILILLNEMLIVLTGTGLLARILLYIEILYTGFILLYIHVKLKDQSTSFQHKVWNIFYFFSFIFMLLLFISLIGNTFGYVSIAVLLSNTVVNAIITGIIFTLLSMILDSIVTVALQSKFFQKSNIVSENTASLTKSINSILGIIIIGFWINSIIASMGFSDQFWSWLGGALNSSWKIGTTTISMGAILGVIIVIVITTIVIRINNALLGKEIFPRIRLPRGVPGAITMITRYIIVAFGFYFVLSVAGIDLGKFGLIAGALGVGIGFGLQNIVFNFIAGLVLAFERPFQVGDVIEIDQLLGFVTSIGVRSSTIKTYDGSEVIVPNGNLISNDVINWTLSDRKKRREVPVSVAYGSNPHEVLEILSRVAGEHPNVLESPAPWATFEGFGESSLDFKIRFWVALDIGMTVKSEVAMNIYDALEEAGIDIPFPQQDVYIKSLDDSPKSVKQKRDALKKRNEKADEKMKKDLPDTDKKAEEIEPDDDDT